MRVGAGRGGLSQRRGKIFRWREFAMWMSRFHFTRPDAKMRQGRDTRFQATIAPATLWRPLMSRGFQCRTWESELRMRIVLKLHSSCFLSSLTHSFTMAPDSRRRSSQTTPAEISLVHNLKNCFVNLPSSLCSLLVNVNTVRCQSFHYSALLIVP